MTWFDSPDDATKRLQDAGYLADAATATTAFLAGRLEKPLLVEGPAGVGKTELAKAVARATGAELVRLQCYEGLDEARALYEWNYKKQLLRIQATSDDQAWEQTHDEIFTDEFLLTRPLLSAILREEPTVLLIDEVDKTDVEVEGLLLEVLSDFQVTIPELGTVSAVRRPFVVLTSNAARELSEAVKRRCLYLHLDYPVAERERAIVTQHVPDLAEGVVGQLVEVVARLRDPGRPVAVLVNNAGFGLRTRIVGADVAEHDGAFEVMIRAVSVLGSAAAETMKARGAGTIINVGSVSGETSMNAYSAIKAWVNTWSEVLANELHGSGVTVTVLEPGWVRTEFHERAELRSSSIPGFLWLDAEYLVDHCLRDAEKGRVVSIPSARFKVLTWFTRHLPSGSMRAISRRIALRRRDTVAP